MVAAETRPYGREMEKNPNSEGSSSMRSLSMTREFRKGILLSQTYGMNRSEHEELMRGQVLSVLLSMNKVYGCTLWSTQSSLSNFCPFRQTGGSTRGSLALLQFTLDSIYS